MKKTASSAFSYIAYLLPLCILASTPLQAGQVTNPAYASSVANLSLNNSTNRLIIKYKQTPETNRLPENMASLLDTLSGTSSSHVRETFSGAQVIQLDQEISVEEMQVITDQIALQDNIEYAEPDLMMYPLLSPDDPRYSEQWHYYQEIGGIKLPTAWDIAQGENTVVAVVDSGYQPHTDLNPNLLPGYDMISDEFVANDGDGRDSDPTDEGDYEPTCNDYISTWHGTHVAGTVAAVTNNALGVAGIAFRAKVVPVRVIGRCGGYLSDIMDGLAWAAGSEIPGLPVNPNPAQVINMSLGGPSTNCPDTALSAIETARQLGATVIVAAGNSSEDSTAISPANCPGVVSVAATDSNGNRARFSNFGDLVDLAAPGVEILSTYNDGVVIPGNESYRIMSGTSMATPHVSGVAALLYSLKPDITPDEVERILSESTQPFPNDCAGCGTGILDAQAALEMLQPSDPGVTMLTDGVAIPDLEGEVGDELMFVIDLPTGASSLTVRSYNGTGDADLHLRFESQPTLEIFDCRPYKYGNEERCITRPVTPGRHYIMLHGYSAFSGVSLIADYQLEDPQPGTGQIFENQDDYPIPQSSLSGVSSPIMVDRTEASGQIQVEVGIQHNWIREISVTLINPTGAKHTLKGFGGSGIDLFETYNLDLGELPSAGEWNLQVKDLGPFSSGNIDYWRIIFP
ncbi:MAG: S8 family serine peptidase [Candidatus Thiodiazotropha sp. LLP2]